MLILSHSSAHAVDRRSYLWRGRHFFNKAQDATQRDRNPLRTIVEFISKLIQGFENQEAPEQELQVTLIFRDKNGVGSLLQIGSQEHLARSRRPKVGIPFESGLVDRPNGPGFK